MMTARAPRTEFWYGLVLASLVGTGGLFLLIFVRVGHHADAAFRALCALLFLAGAAVGWHGRHVPFATALSSVAGARLLSILRGADSHHILLPFHLGMAAGLVAAGWLRRGNRLESSHAPWKESLLSVTFGLCVLVLCTSLVARSFVQAYGTAALVEGVRDRQVAVGVSANFSLYLTTLVAVHVVGPVLVALAWLLSTRNGASTATRVWTGLAVGGALNFAVMTLQYVGVARLQIGLGRSLELGRLPGLFTDSGMSSILLPILVLAVYQPVRSLLEQWRGPHPLLRRLVQVALVVCTLPLALAQGRAVFLSAIGVLLGLALARPTVSGWRDRRTIGTTVALVGGACVLLVIASWALLARGDGTPLPPGLERARQTLGTVVDRGRQGGVLEAVRAIDEPRARLTMAGWRVFVENPTLGTGLGSFMVRTAAWRAVDPRLPPDNPPNMLLGILSDLGLVGLAVCVLLGALFVLRTGPPAVEYPERLLRLLPLMLVPAWLVGYHIVAAEFAAVVFLPLLLAEQRPEDRLRLRTHRRLAALTALATALYACAALGVALRG